VRWAADAGALRHAAGETGLRCESEALWLRWEDVDLDQKFLHVVSGRGGHRVKSGRSRFVPMTARLLAAFKEHFARFRFGG
jgi:integrase